MSEQIKVTDGMKTFDVVNQEGKLLGQMTFNPSDTNILKRHAEVMKQLRKLEEDFSKTVRSTTIIEDMAELDRIVCEKIDYLLNADVSKTLFSIMGPFTPLANGQFFVGNVMDAIAKVIQADMGKQSKRISGKINKYTTKYHN